MVNLPITDATHAMSQPLTPAPELESITDSPHPHAATRTQSHQQRHDTIISKTFRNATRETPALQARDHAKETPVHAISYEGQPRHHSVLDYPLHLSGLKEQALRGTDGKN